MHFMKCCMKQKEIDDDDHLDDEVIKRMFAVLFGDGAYDYFIIHLSLTT